MKNKFLLRSCFALMLLPSFSLTADIAHPIQSCWYQGSLSEFNLASSWTPKKSSPEPFAHALSSTQNNLLGNMTSASSEEGPTESLMMQAYNSKQLNLSSIALGLQMSMKFH